MERFQALIACSLRPYIGTNSVPRTKPAWRCVPGHSVAHDSCDKYVFLGGWLHGVGGPRPLILSP
jgi:hypothetical protein